MRKCFAIGGLLLASVPTAMMAAETQTYTYDARGRLKQVVRSGTVNSGVTTAYQFDRAHNRTRKTTTGVGGGQVSLCNLSINDPYAGGYHTQPLVFTITKSGSCTQNVVISYATTDGTPGSSARYIPTSGSLTFAPADTSKTVTVTVVGSSVDHEEMYLNLTLASGPGVIADGQGMGSIYDNS